jgi:hypothetical protein
MPAHGGIVYQQGKAACGVCDWGWDHGADGVESGGFEACHATSPGPDALGCGSINLPTENPMKKLSLELHCELEIPDDWELVEHSSGIFVLKVGDRFVDFDITPLVTASDAPDATWSDEDEQFTEEILDMVTGLDSEMEISYLQ